MFRLILIFSTLGITLLSCKKEYTCSCQQTVVTTPYIQFGVYYPQSTTSTGFKNTIKDKEDKAKSACKNYESVRINTWGSGESQRTTTETVECELY